MTKAGIIYDRIIIGAGFYGLYAALFCAKKNERILVLECDETSFSRASYINQARVHQGYHYPRSLSTALKSAGYFERFNIDFAYCINSEFDQIYATSAQYSWSDREQFKKFCKAARIPCEELNPDKYFFPGSCDGAFRTREYTYDAMILKNSLLQELELFSGKAEIKYRAKINRIERSQDLFTIQTENGDLFHSPFILNAAYAGINQILSLAGMENFRLKYELCEIILCDVNETLKPVGITVMDGPFFSIMPFGKTGLHSLTSVTFTPHTTCSENIPVFPCQNIKKDYCSEIRLGNCSSCTSKPATAFPYMERLARKYMNDSYQFTYNRSLFSIKPILRRSEIDDSRPTIIRCFSKNPTFVSVLSGKINTVYDLDEVLNDTE